MTLFRLVWKNVTWHPVRSGLLFFFAALSLFLFVFLRSILTTFEVAIRSASSNRLSVQSAVGLFAELPASYLDTIAGVEGVEAACRSSWFGGIYRDTSNLFPSLAVDEDVFLRMYPELRVPDEQRAASLSDRRGCILGKRLAERFDLHVGDLFPILGTLYPLPDGRPWEFVVRGIYRSSDLAFPETLMLFHWAYLQEVRQTLPTAKEVGSLVTIYMVKVARGYEPAGVAARIDAHYAGGPQRTHTQTEQAQRASDLQLLGQIPTYVSLLGGAVLLAMAIAVANAMGIVAGERARTVGLLKALGFPDRSAAYLVLLESLVVVGGGGVVGTCAALASAKPWREILGDTLPMYGVEASTCGLAVLLSIAIGLVGGLLPAIRLARVEPLAVLREEA